MIAIEPYTSSRREQLLDMILDIQQNEFGIPITRDDQPDLLDIDRFYKRSNGNFWLATLDGTVVGSIGLLDISNGDGALRKMFVHRDHRGKAKQTAKILLDTLLLWAHEHGFTTIFLGTTEKFKAAHRFYERNGFAEVPPGSLPTSFPVMKVDVKFYRYPLTD